MTDTPQWNDEPMDARLRDLAKQYNRPNGEVPREAMWDAIAPAVRAAATGAATPVMTPDISPVTRTRRHIAPYAWGAALAAGLVLGIVLEREVLAPRAPASVAVNPASGDSQHVAATAVVPDAGAANAGAPIPVPTSPDAVNPGAAASRRIPGPGQRVATVRTPSSGGRETNPKSHDDASTYGTESDTDVQRLYRLAARQTLVQAEALLTAYRASGDQPRDAESMQQAGRWARDVLSSTRLLLDSPAAKDPQFRALFTDLELVLAQIVQLSGTPLQAGERELIERAMRDRDLLPRLRSALPAGATTD